jgi:mannose-6-phosphate isomerase-like protein (cupin superfamily)
MMGEVLKFNPPLRGDVTITVDPAAGGSPFAMGLLTLPPGADVPAHRYLGWDEALVVHKGQGRAVLNGRALVILPGTTLHVPRASTLSLRNTGTGLLQLIWVTAPAGIEAFFRELARGGAADAAALAQLGQRHGVEFLAEPQAQPAVSVPAAPGRPGPGRRRRRRGGRGRGRHGGQPGQASPPAARPQPPPQQRAPSQPRPPAHQRAPSPQKPAPPRPSSGPVKEVFMSGRWVQVSGEGPVIAPGRERGGRRRRR